MMSININELGSHLEWNVWKQTYAMPIDPILKIVHWNRMWRPSTDESICFRQTWHIRKWHQEKHRTVSYGLCTRPSCSICYFRSKYMEMMSEIVWMNYYKHMLWEKNTNIGLTMQMDYLYYITIWTLQNITPPTETQNEIITTQNNKDSNIAFGLSENANWLREQNWTGSLSPWI